MTNHKKVKLEMILRGYCANSSNGDCIYKYDCPNYSQQVNNSRSLLSSSDFNKPADCQQTGERDKCQIPVPLQSRAELGSSADIHIKNVHLRQHLNHINSRNYEGCL